MASLQTRYGWAFPVADRFMADELQANGSYQADHLDVGLSFVTDWSVACDAGAHVGTWSRPLAARFQRVIAVEPSADTYEALLANLAEFQCANVEPRMVALGTGPGFVSMALDAKNTARANTGARFVTTGDDITVESIDSWELPTLGFLKLDIEGSEPLALEGATATLKRCRPIVLFENKGFCSRYGLPQDASQRLLATAGYRQLAAAGCDLIWGPR